MGLSCGGINCHYNTKNIQSQQMEPLLFCFVAVVQLFMPICYLCLLHLHFDPIFVWSASSAPWCSQQTKKTDCDITLNDCYIFNYVATIYTLWALLLI